MSNKSIPEPITGAAMKSLTRTAPAAVFVAASVALAFPAVATALPEWDIGSYDSCIAKVEDNWQRGKIANLTDAYRECCLKTGGVWTNEGSQSHCVAPPKEAQVSRLPSHVLTPVQPLAPGTITLTPTP
jgi:hypothetical protein